MVRKQIAHNGRYENKQINEFMKKQLLLLVSLIIGVQIFAQVSPNKYWVQFTDKNDSPYSTENPEEFLSERAIQRRIKQGILIDEKDIPVNPDYVQAVRDIGVDIIYTTKWFNSAIIFTTNSSLIAQIEALSFVKTVSKLQGSKKSTVKKEFFSNEKYIPKADSRLPSGKYATSYDYGSAYAQINLVNGIPLHEAGFDGSGMMIGILDAGFLNVNINHAFDSLWANNQILGTRDFVNPGGDVFQEHYHGAMVLSTIGANLPGQMVGTAPKADFWLIRTEDGDTEYLIEELNWVAGAEFADSVGVDVINTSLGYSEFDDPVQNHTYDDMDGNTTPISIGADIAASRGMLCVNSAGNSGSSPWYYITAPADADSICTVGAVDNYGTIAEFSSHGPTSDGQVKPDVCATGSGTTIIDPWSGVVSFGSGTSFSSPITAGMAACLWQSHPSSTNMEVLQAMRESADKYDTPDASYGYGIPDYEVAMGTLTKIEEKNFHNTNFLVYPNPVQKDLYISTNDTGIKMQSLAIYDFEGKRLYHHDKNMTLRPLVPYHFALIDLPPGIFYIQILTNKGYFSKKIVRY